MANTNTNSIGTLSDLTNLISRFAPSDKKTDKLSKNIENLNKTILSLAKVKVQNSMLGGEVSAIARSRTQYNTFAEVLKTKIFGPKTLKDRYGSLRNSLDTFGIVKKDTGGVFDQLLQRREAKQQYINDQLLVNPQMANTRENRAAFAKKFESQQTLQKALNKAQGNIDRLQSQGYTEDQIKRSGLTKRRDEIAAKLVASDNRLYDKVRDKDAVSQNQTESTNETLKKQDEGNQIQRDILSNIISIKELMSPTKKPEGQEEQKSSWLSGLLGTISGFLLSKVGAIAGLLKSGLLAAIAPIKAIVGGIKDLVVGSGKKILETGKNLAKRGVNAVKGIKPLTFARAATGAGLMAYSADLNTNEDQELADIQQKLAEDPTSVTFGGDGPKTIAEFEKQQKETNIANTESAKKDLSRFTPFGKTNDNFFIPSKPPVENIGDKIAEKVIQNTQIKETSGKGSDVVIAPSSTTNNTTATTNIFGKFSPRNSEPSQSRYVMKAFTL